MAEESTVKLTDENFKNEVMESDKKVLVDFWAPWCGPCKQVSPIVEELGEEHEEVKIGKVNVDENQNLAAEYGIMSIPTLIVFEDGEILNKQVGAASKERLESLIK